MARILSQALIRESQVLAHDPSPPFLFINLRRRSNKAQLFEFDLSTFAAADESESGSGSEAKQARRLQDAIRAIIVRRAAPDWIPFLPGSSYWIPPPPLPRPAAAGKTIMTEEEELSFSSDRGWPSFSYFAQGVLPRSMDNNSEKASHSPKESDDEEIGLEFTD